MVPTSWQGVEGAVPRAFQFHWNRELEWVLMRHLPFVQREAEGSEWEWERRTNRKCVALLGKGYLTNFGFGGLAQVQSLHVFTQEYIFSPLQLWSQLYISKCPQGKRGEDPEQSQRVISNSTGGWQSNKTTFCKLTFPNTNLLRQPRSFESSGRMLTTCSMWNGHLKMQPSKRRYVDATYHSDSFPFTSRNTNTRCGMTIVEQTFFWYQSVWFCWFWTLNLCVSGGDWHNLQWWYACVWSVVQLHHSSYDWCVSSSCLNTSLTS